MGETMTEVEQAETTGFSFVLGSREYRADDLTLNDVADIEEEFGETIMALAESGRIKPLLHMAWCIRRHSEPDLTLAEVGNVTMGQLVNEQSDEGEQATKRPTKAPAANKKRASSGARGTRASTESSPGTSDA